MQQFERRAEGSPSAAASARTVVVAAVLAAVAAIASCGAPQSVHAPDAARSGEAAQTSSSATSSEQPGVGSSATGRAHTGAIASTSPVGLPPGSDAATGASADARPLPPRNLRVEYLTNPLGIGERKPRFSWEVDDPRRGAVQSAYEVRVAASAADLAAGNALVWDSARVASSASNQVEYAGAPLLARHFYAWTVRTFDAAGAASPWSEPASFGVGPLEESDWSAHWIGDTAGVSSARPGRNGYHSRFAAKEDEFRWIQIDLGEEKVFDGIRLYPARPFDWTPDTPGYLFPVRFKVWVSSDPEFTANFQLIDDVSYYDLKNPLTAPYEFHVPNTRFKMRYMRVGVFKSAKVDDRGHAITLAEMQVVHGQEVVSTGCKATASDSLERPEWSVAFLTDGETESRPPEGQDALPARLMRKTFKLGGPVKRAVAYASALGMYQLFVNGKRIGDDALAPGWTDYLTRVEYQTFDVTQALKAGDNVIGAMLGDGWYSGRIGLASQMPGFPIRGIYARKPRFLVQVDVELESGEKHTIASDASWRALSAGPIRTSDILDGEGYDARSEKDGWSAPGYFEHEWEPVEVGSDSRPVLVAQACEPIRVVQEIAPVKLSEPKPGHWVFDMGQNLVGWCRLKIRGPAHSLVRLRHAEVLEPDGTLYVANLRGAPQTDFYALRGGGEEVFEPHFTYHGFRYVEVTGLVAPPDLGDLTAKVVCTSARETGTFACSDPMLDKLWQNIRWTLRGNLMSVPTDCPQRDERLGWMGDMNAFAGTAIYQMDLAAFFTKWIQDVRDAQADDGRFPDFAPHPFDRNKSFTGTPGWGDAGVHVPWLAYVGYGDKRLLEKSFAGVLRWIEYVRSRNPDLIWTNGRGNDYGDWLNGADLEHAGWSKAGSAVPKEVLATAFFARSVETAAKMAAVLGRADDAQRMKELAARIKEAFHREFVTSEGVVKGDTQAGYALALAFDLLAGEHEERARSRLAADVREKHGGHLTTGFQTTHLALNELALGADDAVELAGQVVREKSFPSWGYMIDQGATTMWERRDGYIPGRGFQDAGMNSFNHYAFGSVGEYLMAWIGGIQPDEANPGYARFTIRPRGGSQIQQARAAYDSIRGKILSAWKLDGDRFHLEVTIPANTSARVCLPTRERESIQVDGRPLDAADPNVKLVSLDGDAALLEVRAGTYAFACKRPAQ